MAEKRELPQGQTFINMKGDIKAVVSHLAFDTQMQTQMGFFPCDENGIRIATPEVSVAEVKKNLAVVDRAMVVEKKEPVVIIPEGANINPLDEEVVEENEVAVENTDATEPIEKKKRGRKPTTK